MSITGIYKTVILKLHQDFETDDIFHSSADQKRFLKDSFIEKFMDQNPSFKNVHRRYPLWTDPVRKETFAQLGIIAKID